MRTNNLLILFLAIVMGGIAAFLARNWLQSHALTSASEPTGTIVVAALPLDFGTVVTRDNVTEIPWAATTIPEGSFATKQDLLKDGRRVVLMPLGRHEPVLRAKVTGPGQRGSLSSLLEEGKRAVTVRVDDVRGVAGFILPNDRVDVVLIRTDGGTGRSYSDVILQRVKVLAIDQLAGAKSDQPAVARAVTLELSSDEAQKVLLGTNVGKLSLILRQAGEGNPEPNRRITEGDLSSFEPVTPVAGSAAPAPVRRSDSATVVIVRGTRDQEYEVMRGSR